jgi:hypothetical protein
MPTLDHVPCREWPTVVEWMMTRADHHLFIKTLNNNNNNVDDEWVHY